MKNRLLILTFLSTVAFGQVGINTNQPTRTLDINGDLYISNLENKSTDNNYVNVLVANSEGEVEAFSKEELKKLFNEETIETKKLYIDNKPDETKVVPCGRFKFRFSNATKPQIALVNNLDVMIYFTRISKISNETIGAGDKNVTYDSSLSFTKNDYSFKDLNSDFNLNNLNEYYLSYPGDKNMYRVTFLARNMIQATQGSPAKNNYTIICEKF